MNTKRQIKGGQYNITELVQNAINTADSQELNTDKAREVLTRMGHRDPADELVIRYARETAILAVLARETGAYGFENQIGKIDFSNVEKATASVNAYLNRRNQAHRARWTQNSRGY